MKQKNIAKKLRTVELGKTYQSDNTYEMHGKSITIYKEDGEVLAIFIKNVIPADIVKLGRSLIRFKTQSNSRGMAAGINEKRKEKYGEKGGLSLSNNVYSSTIGYLEKNGFYKCRQTAIYAKNKKEVDDDGIPVIEYISKIFEKHAPEHFKKQKAFIKKVNPNMRLGKSAFTTFALNVDFRTHAHQDKGDFKSGLGNLAVFNAGNFTGGELLLPEYKVGFDIKEGDVLLFDVHQVHCNNPIKGEGRISVVAFAREKIEERCKGLSKSAILANTGVNITQRK